MSLFPIIQPRLTEKTNAPGLCVDTAWDFESSALLYKNGSPALVTGSDAVLVWAWNALHTPRFVHEIFTWSYGNEIESLIGKPFTDELKQSEAARYVRECLIINPYITDVNEIEVTFSDDKLKINCSVMSIYGEVNLNV